jgi:hypothetical protein
MARLPENDEDFLSWLTVEPSEWYPEASAGPTPPSGTSPLVRSPVPTGVGLTGVELSPDTSKRPLSPLHAEALLTSPSIGVVAGFQRLAASGFQRLAASFGMSTGGGTSSALPHAVAMPSALDIVDPHPQLVAVTLPPWRTPPLGSTTEVAERRPTRQRGSSISETAALPAASGSRVSGPKRSRREAGIDSAARGAVPEAMTLDDARRQIDALSAENSALRAQLRALTTASTKDSNAQDRERQRQLSRIRALAVAGEDADVRQAVLRYKDLHSDFGRDRWVALRHHLTALRSLLAPSLVTKVCMWTIGQEGGGEAAAAAVGGSAGAADRSSSGNVQRTPVSSSTPTAATAAHVSVWSGVVAHCHLDAEQQRYILAQRDAARARRLEFSSALNALHALEEAVAGNFRGLELQMNVLMSAVSPVQNALLLDWIDHNQTALGALPSLTAWPGSAT